MSKPMTKTAKEILNQVYLFGMNGGLGYEKFDNELSPDQALKEIEAIHQQEIAKARLNEVQNAYEYWINGRRFISSYFRDRIADLSQTQKEHKEEVEL